MAGGEWSGTLESPSFPTKTIAARFQQESDCVDGSWNTAPPETRWVGGISGFAGTGNFAGDMSFEVTVNGKLCSGLGKLTGLVSDTAAVLTWTLSTYSAENCGGGVPSQMTMKLHR